MIDVDLLSVIRRWHGREKLSIREISKRTGLSRNTIRKYVASGVTEPKYPPRKSVSKLDPFAQMLWAIAGAAEATPRGQAAIVGA